MGLAQGAGVVLKTTENIECPLCPGLGKTRGRNTALGETPINLRNMSCFARPTEE
jgi:hypothetical protein